LLTKEQRNPFFNQWESHFNSFDEWVENTGQTPLEACLKFVSSYNCINNIIVGVQSAQQLLQILSAIKKNDLVQVQKDLEVNDEMLINPSNWNLVAARRY